MRVEWLGTNRRNLDTQTLGRNETPVVSSWSSILHTKKHFTHPWPNQPLVHSFYRSKAGLNLDTPTENRKFRMSRHYYHSKIPLDFRRIQQTSTSHPRNFQDQQSGRAGPGCIISAGGISGGDGLCETLGGFAGRLWRQDHWGGLRGLGKHLEGRDSPEVCDESMATHGNDFDGSNLCIFWW